MTQFSDQLRQGRAYFNGWSKWNASAGTNGIPTATAPNDTQTNGAMHTQTFYLTLGTASTALASGIFYSASGSTSTTGAMTATGALVSGGVATFDVPRGIRFTASIDLSTTTFTVVGTDGYGQAQTYSRTGPTGNTIGNAGSYVDSLVTFKTVTTISHTAQATAIATTTLMIGDNNCFGLPYVLTNVGNGLGAWINGALATVPATFAAAFTPTGTPTATTADVRGTCTLATTALADGSRYITIGMITPNVALTESTDNKVNTFGATPYTT